MNEPRDDEELLALLKDVYPTAAIKPDETARRQLLDALALDNVVAINAPITSTKHRRRFGSHVSAVTLSAIGAVSLAGVAAAAVVTNTLPGPTRAIAYDLGLPVTSPALYQARQQLSEVKGATNEHHADVARQLAQGLIKDLRLLNHQDLSQIRTPVTKTLTQLGLLDQVTSILGLTSTTTTTVPPTSSSTTSTTTTTVLVPPTLPSVGSITGSTGLGGVVKNTTSGATPLLP
ncbi:MAG TPA: hypothetical protein VIC81_07795 [Acidimicrobiales bacterium]